jgi:hypothetical protein
MLLMVTITELWKNFSRKYKVHTLMYFMKLLIKGNYLKTIDILFTSISNN